MKVKFKSLLFALVAAATVTACDSGGYQRGIFTGFVTNATEDEVTSKMGKPDQIDASDPNAPQWIYNKKTFDPDNQNKNDDKSIVAFKKDVKTGKNVGAEVVFL